MSSMRLLRLLAFATCALTVLTTAPRAETLRVPASFPTIQQAIDAASPGDEVLVSAGAYPETLNTRGKRLTLRGEAGAGATIVDGRHLGSVLTFNGGGVVEGFTFTNGLARNFGGGILVQGGFPTVIRDNVVQGNRSGYEWETGNGGGIWSVVDHLVIERNVIHGNSAGANGGGLAVGCNADCVVRDNLIDSNDALWGAGASINNAEFLNNVVTNNVAEYYPGGIEASWSRIHGNTVVSNHISLLIEAGGGIVAIGDPSSMIVSNNLVANNQGRPDDAGGIQCYGCTLECNDSWGHAADDFMLMKSDSTGRRNFSADPLFCVGSDDYGIGQGSPCAPANSRGCGLIGARGVACGITSSVRATWGRLKARYR